MSVYVLYGSYDDQTSKRLVVFLCTPISSIWYRRSKDAPRGGSTLVSAVTWCCALMRITRCDVIADARSNPSYCRQMSPAGTPPTLPVTPCDVMACRRRQIFPRYTTCTDNKHTCSGRQECASDGRNCVARDVSSSVCGGGVIILRDGKLCPSSAFTFSLLSFSHNTFYSLPCSLSRYREQWSGPSWLYLGLVQRSRYRLEFIVTGRKFFC